jgi:S-methylmethionine-dependent homocysteine/selenocysteine methylase
MPLPGQLSVQINKLGLRQAVDAGAGGEETTLEADQPVSVFLANCCSPEAVTRALPDLLALGTPTGGYANTFEPIDPEQKTVHDRHDLDPQAYAAHVEGWIAAGARIVGGCCGTMPEHIALLRQRIDAGSA